MRLLIVFLASASSYPFRPEYYLPSYKVNPFIREHLPWDIYDPYNKDKSVSWSTEHVIPRSFIPIKDATCDLFNLFNTSPIINSHRSNYKFTSSIPITKKLTAISNSVITSPATIINTHTLNYKDTKRKLWLPVEKARGPISRSIAYMMLVYKINPDYIIDLETLNNWQKRYPIQNWEIKHMWKIYKIQGNINPFVLL